MTNEIWPRFCIQCGEALNQAESSTCQSCLFVQKEYCADCQTELVSAAEEYVGLCLQCQVWREMPDKNNELVDREEPIGFLLYERDSASTGQKWFKPLAHEWWKLVIHPTLVLAEQALLEHFESIDHTYEGKWKAKPEDYGLAVIFRNKATKEIIIPEAVEAKDLKQIGTEPKTGTYD